LEKCPTPGCPRPARGDGKVCKVCYLKQWHARQGECSLGHCPRRIDAAVLCTTHYNRKRRGLPDWDAPVPQRMNRGAKCMHKDGCPEPVQARGYCNVHYERLLRLGDPGPVGLLKAARGEGSKDGRGYRVITVDGKRYLEHRWVMEQQRRRPLWPDEEVHHKNRIRDDNDPDNLELWSTAQPRGGRVEDIIAFYAGRYPEEVIAFVVGHYPDEVRQALAARR
jgi:hypothetical protein